MKREFAGKWNYKDGDHYLYKLPEKAATYRDMNDEVQCASCGKLLKFGDCYTSYEIQTLDFGMGYGVCEECYDEEIKRRLEFDYEYIV